MLRVLRALGLAAVLAALLSDPAAWGDESTQSLELAIAASDYWFEPAWPTVRAGTTVRWTNHDAESHTVTEEWKRFDAEIWPAESFSFTFTEPGVYFYYCEPHGWMIGEITVVANDGSKASKTLT